ncbi:MAG: AI-2E family transporter, partial [Ktedonobacterales bacterium]|nr:AI-2E family transporter [Ktedonobacterales bacterium]
MSLENFLPGRASTPLAQQRDWVRALLIPLTILAWGAVIITLFLLAGHVVETLILLAVAILIAYALQPIINRLDTHMPRWVAITITYLVFGAAFAGLIYTIAGVVSAEVSQLSSYVEQSLQPGNSDSSLQILLRRLGIPSGEVRNLGQTLLSALTGALRDIFPILSGILTAVIGLVVILVLSIYFVAAGPHVGRWLRTATPLSHRHRVIFFLDTLNDVVGGYIRGQVTLAALIGLLVGLGMYFLFHLPFAILLGLLAFVLEFIPFLGVIISGGACVLVALTQGPFTALLVLGYFAIVHLIEGEIVGPRIVGRAVG